MIKKNDPTTFLARELRPEARLVLCCTRTEVSTEIAGEIKSLAALPLDWEFLCASADKHRVTQLLFRNLSAVAPASIPADIRSRLRHQFYVNAGSNLKLAHALIDLLQKFRAAAIPVIPFKGSILANGTYGKLALRQNYDVDLFIREQDIEESKRLLVAEDYALDENFDRAERFWSAVKDVEIDLHWAFTPRYFHHSVDFDQLFAGTREESLLEDRVRTFSAEDFLLILCLQVVKDCWERQQQLEHLSKVCDIAEHLRANPDINWPRMAERARMDGLERIFHIGLIMAHELLGANLPVEIKDTIGSDTRARKCAKNMCRLIFTEADTLSPLDNPYFSLGLRFRQLRFYLGIRERYRERLMHLGEIFNVYKLVRT